MKIAIIGVKGIPVVYSGFETFVEQLSTRLVEDKNFQVTVYCRSPYVNKKNKKYKGVSLVNLPTIKSKNLETIFHSFLSTCHACLFRRYDVIYYVGVGNAMFTLFPRIIGIKTVINVDGFDWKREKWGGFAKSYLKLSSYLAMYFPNEVVTDSLVMRNYYFKKHKKNYHYIPYGYMDNFKIRNNLKILRKYNLKKDKYFAWVGRIVPENHLEDLLLAYVKLDTDLKCVVIGDNFYHDEYIKKMHDFSKKNKNIVFTGFLSREDYAVMVKNAFAYIETKRSGGTHPSLVEAMGFGSLIISNGNIANKQLLESNALYYTTNKELTDDLRYITSPEVERKIISYKRRVKLRAIRIFGWRKIIGQYKTLFDFLSG